MYELVYSCGGHGGPYPNLQEALQRAEALLHGCRSMQSVCVVERDAAGRGGYGKTVARVERSK